MHIDYLIIILYLEHLIEVMEALSFQYIMVIKTDEFANIIC